MITLNIISIYHNLLLVRYSVNSLISVYIKVNTTKPRYFKFIKKLSCLPFPGSPSRPVKPGEPFSPLEPDSPSTPGLPGSPAGPVGPITSGKKTQHN